MAIRIRTPIDPDEPGVLSMLQHGTFFKLAKLRDNASFQLEPLAVSSSSYIDKLEEENKRLKGLLRETEYRLNREKHSAHVGRLKNPLHPRSRSNSHPDILHGSYSSGSLAQEMSVSCCMNTPTPSEQSDDTEYSENCPLTPISVASDGPPSDDECFLLSCTLCLKKMSVGELEGHSRVCSATSSSSTSTSSPSDSLVIAVSKVSAQQLLRVTTRTSRSDFPQQQCDVVRSAEDIQLLHDSLLQECPNCVIPPIVRQSHSHFSQQTEFQRFLARVAAHESLKSHDLLKKFLTASDLDMACWREEFFAKQQMNHMQTRARTPAQQNNEDGALQHAKEYLSSLESNLRSLAKHLQRQKTVSQKDSTSHWFQAIAKSEPRTTYLQTVCHGLARVCDDIGKQQDDIDEQSVVQDLYSIIEYVHSAQALLARVHSTINEYLYWDEEVKVFEMAGIECSPVEYELQRTDSVSSVSSNSSSTSVGDVRKMNALGQTSSVGTLRWAEANASCVSAKDRVEMMCNGLADELTQFDLRKEIELKQFLLEFADNKLEVCDKMQSKWQAGRMLLDSPIEPPQRAIQLDIDIDENGGSGW